jgi:hypothetical protein
MKSLSVSAMGQRTCLNKGGSESFLCVAEGDPLFQG